MELMKIRGEKVGSRRAKRVYKERGKGKEERKGG